MAAGDLPPPARDRRGATVRIAGVSQTRSFARTVDGNRDYVARLLERICSTDRPDLVCLPEAFTASNVPADSVRDVAEAVPGPTTDRVAMIARTHRCYVICPIYTRRDDRFWNSAVVIGRDGEIEGVYDKACPSPTAVDGHAVEFESGVTPGAAASYWRDLDFGRVGIQICMDVHFSGGWQALADAGAKLVLWPSAFGGGLRLQGHALRHAYHVVSAVRRGSCRIINPCGRVVAESAGAAHVTADLSLDFFVIHDDGGETPLAEKIRGRHGDRVRINSYPDDALVLVEIGDPALTAVAVQQELGVEPAARYLERLERAYRRSRAGASTPVTSLPADETAI